MSVDGERGPDNWNARHISKADAVDRLEDLGQYPYSREANALCILQPP